MKLRWLKRAHTQLQGQLTWWRENAESSRPLEDELQRVQALLKETPFAGIRVLNARSGTRRVLLRTQHLLYYRVNEKDGFVEVLRFWHASRGRTPKL